MKRGSYIGEAGVTGGAVDVVVAPMFFHAQNRYRPRKHVIPADGVYKIYAWGAGGDGANYTDATYNGVKVPGGSGSLAVTEIALSAGDEVTITVPTSAYQPTVVVLPGGRTITAGPGGAAVQQPNGTFLPGAGGVATGGDINIPGSAATIVPLTLNTKTSPDGGGTNPGLGGRNGGRDTPNKYRYTGAPGAPGYDEFKGGDGESYSSADGGESFQATDYAETPGGGNSTWGGNTKEVQSRALVIIKRVG